MSSLTHYTVDAEVSEEWRYTKKLHHLILRWGNGRALGLRQAQNAAKEMSLCRGVSRVIVTRVTEQHVETYRKGQPS